LDGCYVGIQGNNSLLARFVCKLDELGHELLRLLALFKKHFGEIFKAGNYNRKRELDQDRAQRTAKHNHRRCRLQNLA